MWSTRDQEAKSLDERKESPSVSLWVCVAVLSGKEADREPRQTTGWAEEGERRVHQSCRPCPMECSLGLYTCNMESHFEPILI